MQEPDAIVLEREQLSLQERLRQSFLKTMSIKGGAKSVPSFDFKHCEKQLKQASEGCRRIRAELFEACCEFQRDCNAARLRRLAILTASLKYLEHNLLKSCK
jgi:hypothetical protein